MLAIGCDHGGFVLKKEILEYFDKNNIQYKDFGCHTTDSVDYPDIAEVVCNSVVNGECEKGILVCGTGIGMSIAANKIKGIRAALLSDTFSARMTAAHNDSNVIALGGRVIGTELAIEIINAYLSTEFQGGRHKNRIDKIKILENK
ncbi:MAG: ribose 5-phosphate isomerase B [Ruminococcaceae bacterium]|nr:ribose 5-phosphate isomerase B [Oscillospiraceae bacterium]